MKAKLIAMLMALLLVQGCVYRTYGSYYDPGGYEYYDLPSGYHYEYRDNGPVIVEKLTGALVTIAALRLLFPRHHWRRMYHEPHFVYDVRHGHRPPMMHNRPPAMHNRPPMMHNRPPAMHNRPPAMHNRPPAMQNHHREGPRGRERHG